MTRHEVIVEGQLLRSSAGEVPVGRAPGDALRIEPQQRAVWTAGRVLARAGGCSLQRRSLPDQVGSRALHTKFNVQSEN